MSVFQAAMPTGTYPTLGAGYLARQNYINALTNKGWWKFAEYAIPSSLQNANRLTSAFILFNGINSSAASASGTIEFDLYYNTSSGYAIQGIYINNGSIDPNNVCAVVESDKISLYANLTANYYSYAFSMRSEWTQKGENASGTLSEYISFTSSFYGTTAPEGAVYAVVRNIASYAESAETLSRGVEISITTETGWYQFMEASGLSTSHGYSAIVLVNGVLHTQQSKTANVEESGIIEVDYYHDGPTDTATRYGISILAGNLDASEFYITASGNSISVYKNFANSHQKVKFTEISVSGTNATTTYVSALQSAAPTGGATAVIRNNASFAESAGHLAKRQYLSAGTTNLGWYKIGSVSVSELNFTDNFSVILLLNGIYASQGQSGAAESGIIEFEGRQREEVLETCRINILAGNLNAGDLSCVIGDNSCDLYLNMPSLYNSFEFTVINEARASTEHSDLFTFDTEFYGASAPSGAVYAVVRNIASYAESIPVASETVFGGAKMWVDGGKLYIKTE